MRKKEYSMPEAEIIRFSVTEISMLTTSGATDSGLLDEVDFGNGDDF
ncbi:MAG: hypothetical protein IJL89_00190 [Firmicutes bacterium]|nr:hypothetical protein [Bacillota bacterium]